MLLYLHASSVICKISSAKSFGWNITRQSLCFLGLWVIIKISNFVFIFSQSNRKKNCWSEIVLYGMFLTPCYCTVLLNQDMFFRQREISPFAIICKCFKTTVFTCSKSTMETLELWIKSVQSSFDFKQVNAGCVNILVVKQYFSIYG